MAKEITILGFAAQRSERALYDGNFNGELWTLNDWFNFFPQIKKPHRLYQIHKGYTGLHTDYSWRTNVEWKDLYNKTGAKIIVTELYDGLQNQRLFDESKAELDWGKWRLQSSIDYMLYDAWNEGVTTVELIGVKMNHETEYAYQMPTAKYNSDFLKEKGIRVINCHENNWNVKNVDWEKLREVRISYSDCRVCHNEQLIDSIGKHLCK